MHIRLPILLAIVVIAAAILPAPARAQRPERIEIVNELDRPVLVWIDGDPRLVVDANSTSSTTDVPEGIVLLQATTTTSGTLLATERTSISPGETFTWTLYPVAIVGEERGTGVVVIENDLDHVVEVRLGDNLFGFLAPGAVRVEPRIVAGNVIAVASSDTRGVVAERTLTIEPGEIVRWRIGTLAGP